MVDVLATIRSSRFDLPLTYRVDAGALEIGEIVRVPLGTREVLAFVVSATRDARDDPALRAVRERLDVPRAFDATGLALARFIAERYICTLGEALGAVTLASALPRARDMLRRGEMPVPTDADQARFVHLIWQTLPERFALEGLLRHPEARRCGDRGQLLRWVGALVRRGALARERVFERPRLREYRIRTLVPGNGDVKGAQARALVAFVARNPGAPRADAVLAGFSAAVIARALRSGAIVEDSALPASEVRAPLMLPEERSTDEQAAAIARIGELLAQRRFAELLLEGVTGSGKTHVYIAAIAQVVQTGGRAIVLVPEISLTPQTARRFERVFGARVAVLHSALSERERYDAFQACMNGWVDVVVGARSAAFAPLRDVRLLVVDESHEGSYKQESVPRYSAVEVARERMRIEGGLVLLGSATPSLETFAAVRAGHLECVRLERRPSGAPLPAVRVVDLTESSGAGRQRILSNALIDAMSVRLERGEKVVLFVNRRGSANVLLCRTCGAVPKCPRCTVSLAVHRGEARLRCHYCDFQTAIPSRCPTCGSDELRELGVGTERVVEAVGTAFPQARVVRMDSDSTTRVGDHARLLGEFGERGDVLVGTQMVAKGLDFPSVTLVGVVVADIGLQLPDFRAAERTFNLIAQACGRSGRALPGEAIVQTFAPTHPAIVYAARHDFRGFAEYELREREAAGFPPAQRMIYLGVIGRARDAVVEIARQYAAAAQADGAAEVLGPAPYPIARVNREWRYRVVLRGRNARALRALVRTRILPLARVERRARLAIAVDP